MGVASMVVEQLEWGQLELVDDRSLLDGMRSYTGKKRQGLDYTDLIGAWVQTAKSQQGRVEGDKVAALEE